MGSPRPASPRLGGTAAVIDFNAGQADRFSPPKASIYHSSNGVQHYGVADRPACRVLRYQADAACAAASAAAEQRASARPSGRRHDALMAYLDSVRQNEQRWGLEALQARSNKRSTATVYAARLGGSQGVQACLVWQAPGPQGSGPGAEDEPLGQPASPRRPASAPPASSRSPTSLDMWSSPPPAGMTSPRFRARHDFEQRRCATPDLEACKARGYLAMHRERKAAAAVREEREAAIAAAWPHGCPIRLHHAFRAVGLSVPAVQHHYDGARIERCPSR